MNKVNILMEICGPFSLSLTLTDGDQDAADARDAAGDHGEEEDPPPAPLVHRVPAHEVGGHLHGRADEEPQIRVDAQVGRVERQPVVHDGIHEPAVCPSF